MRLILIGLVLAGLMGMGGWLLTSRPWQDQRQSLPKRMCWDLVDTKRVLAVLPKGSYEASENAGVRVPATDARCSLRLPGSDVADRRFTFSIGTLTAQQVHPFYDFNEGIGAGFRTAGPNDEIIVADHQAWLRVPQCHPSDKETQYATVVARDTAAESKAPDDLRSQDYLISGRVGAAPELLQLLVDITNGLRAQARCEGPPIAATEIHGMVEQSTVPGGGSPCGVEGITLPQMRDGQWAVSTAQSPSWSECIVRTAPNGTVVLRFIQRRGPLANAGDPPPQEPFVKSNDTGVKTNYEGGAKCGAAVVANSLVLDDRWFGVGETDAQKIFQSLSTASLRKSGCPTGPDQK